MYSPHAYSLANVGNTVGDAIWWRACNKITAVTHFKNRYMYMHSLHVHLNHIATLDYCILVNRGGVERGLQCMTDCMLTNTPNVVIKKATPRSRMHCQHSVTAWYTIIRITIVARRTVTGTIRRRRNAGGLARAGSITWLLASTSQPIDWLLHI